MKNIFGLSLFASVLFLISCEEDDTSDVASIEGTWNLTALDYSGTTTTDSPIIVLTQDFVGIGREFDASATFNSDGTYDSSGSYVVDLTTTVSGISQTAEVSVTEFLDGGTYVLDSKENPTSITISNPNSEALVGTITKLTETEFEFGADLTQISETPIGTQTVVISTNYTMTRQ